MVIGRRLHLIATVIVAAAIGVAFVAVASASGQKLTPSSADEDQIRHTFESSVRLRAEAARTFRTEAFVSVFVDDAGTPLTDIQRRALESFAPGLAKPGFLTYNRLYFEHWRQGAQAFARVKAARDAGRLPDQADLRAAIPPRTDPLVMPTITYRVLTVDGGRAYVEADTDAIAYRVRLLRVGGSWLIAGEDDVVHN